MPEVFGWIGSTRRDIVIGKLLKQLSEWANVWSAGNIEEVVSVSDIPESSDLHWFALGDACVGVDRSAASLGAWLTNCTDDANPLAIHLGESALRALLGMVVASTSAEMKRVDWMTIPRVQREPRFGALHVGVSLGELRLMLVLTREMADARAAVKRGTSTEALTPRASLANRLTTPLRIELDLGELAVGEARALAGGDILLTQVPLSRLADVFIGERVVPAIQARPGGADTRRAVAIELSAPIGDAS